MEIAEVEGAIEAFDRSLAGRMEDSTILFSRGVAHLISGNVDQALRDLEGARKLDPSREDIAGMIAAAQSVESENADKLGDLELPLKVRIQKIASQYYREYSGKSLSDLEDALHETSRASESNPEDARNYFVRGLIRSAKGDYDRALADLERATELAPTLMSAYEQKELIQTIEGDMLAATIEHEKGNVARIALAAMHGARGMNLYTAAEFDLAIEAFDLAIALWRNEHRFYRGRALAYASKGDYDSAIADFGRAIEVNPGELGIYVSRGLLRIEKGDFAKAIEDFDSALEIDPSRENAHKGRAVAYVRKSVLGSTPSSSSDLNEALSSLDQLVELNPKDVDSYSRRAVVHELRAESGKAISDYSKVIELAPDTAIAFLKKGIVHLALGEIDLGTWDVNHAFELDKGIAAQYLDEDSYSETLRGTRIDGAAHLVNRGNAYRALGRRDAALRELNLGVRSDSQSGITYLYRGRVRLERGETESALEDFELAVDLAPRNSRSCEDVVKYCTDIIASDPENSLAFSCRGNAYGVLGDHASALGDLRDALKLDGKLARARFHRGRLLVDYGLPEMAIRELDHAICLTPGLPASYFHRGRAYYSNGYARNALEDFEIAIDLDPRNEEVLEEALRVCDAVINSDQRDGAAYECRGNVLRLKGEVERSVDDLKQAMSLKSASPRVYLYMGLALTCQGDYDGAIESYNFYIGLVDDDYVVYASRGLANYVRGDHLAAIEDMDVAIALNEGDAALFRVRGLAHGAVGNSVLAQRDFETARDIERGLVSGL